MRKRIIPVFFAGLLGLAGCKHHDSNDTPPSDQVAQIAGNYVGTFSSSQVTNADISMTLNQSGTQLSGTLNAVSGAVQGSVSGTVGTDTFVITVTQTQPCGGSYSGSGRVNGTVLTGSINGSNCNGSVSGTFSVTKQ